MSPSCVINRRSIKLRKKLGKEMMKLIKNAAAALRIRKRCLECNRGIKTAPQSEKRKKKRGASTKTKRPLFLLTERD